MGKFRKKPVVIEAFLFVGQSNVRAAGQNDDPTPDWFVDAIHDGTISVARGSGANGHLIIKTLEGDHRADQGDWIIRGIKGELYPCKPDIFAATYDEVQP